MIGKKALGFLLAMVICAGLGACGAEESPAVTTQAQTGQSEASSGEARQPRTRTIADGMGREVEVPAAVEVVFRGKSSAQFPGRPAFPAGAVQPVFYCGGHAGKVRGSAKDDAAAFCCPRLVHIGNRTDFDLSIRNSFHALRDNFCHSFGVSGF